MIMFFISQFTCNKVFLLRKYKLTILRFFTRATSVYTMYIKNSRHNFENDQTNLSHPISIITFVIMLKNILLSNERKVKTGPYVFIV